MEEPSLAGRLALGLLGAFFALISFVALRRRAMDLLLTRAVAALAPRDPRVTRAEAWRAWLLAVQLLMLGVTGLLLLALLDLALPAMVATLAYLALYALWFAPRYLDPFDPPEPEAGGHVGRVLAVHLGATTLVSLGHHAGLLRPVSAQPWPVLVAVALLILGFVGHGLHLLRRMNESPAPAERDWIEAEAIRRDTDDEAAIREVPLILSPGWNSGPFFDARDRQDIRGRLPHDLLPWEEAEALDAWQGLFREIADPEDPEQCRFLTPDGAARMEAMGRPVFERLAARLPPGRISFEPVPWPRRPTREFTSVKLMTDADQDPLWITAGDVHEPVPAEPLGLSWSLSAAIHRWANDHASSIDLDDPGGARLWDAAEAAAHDAEGEALAHRLARELAATGRGHVAVSYWSERREAAIAIQG